MRYLIFAAIFVAACTTTQANETDEIAELIKIIEQYEEITSAHEERAFELLSIIAAQQEYIKHIEQTCGQKI